MKITFKLDSGAIYGANVIEAGEWFSEVYVTDSSWPSPRHIHLNNDWLASVVAA